MAFVYDPKQQYFQTPQNAGVFDRLMSAFTAPGTDALVGGPWGALGQVFFKNVAPSLFMKARAAAPRQQFLSPHSAETLQDYVKNGGAVRLSEDGKTGYIVSPEGDLQNVFNYGEKGAGGEAVEDAIKQGAKTLDAFDGFLPKFYQKYGFKETGRVPFDPQYAPPGWDYQQLGSPDVIFMRKQ